MIAMVGLEKFKLNQFSELDHSAKPRWALDEDAAFLRGAGRGKIVDLVIKLYEKIFAYNFFYIVIFFN